MSTKAEFIHRTSTSFLEEVDDTRLFDPRDFLAVYDAYFPRVYNYIRYRCGDMVVAEDLTAAVFERALNHFATYRPERAPFGAWLFTIARNLVSNHLRAERNHTWMPLDEVDSHPLPALSPEDAVIQSQTEKELLTALACLDERGQDVLSLKFAARLTNRRIAEITGLSESNVGVILYRAIHHLREIFDDQRNDGRTREG